MPQVAREANFTKSIPRLLKPSQCGTEGKYARDGGKVAFYIQEERGQAQSMQCRGE